MSFESRGPIGTGARRRASRPPHLRGKQIGLFYRDQARLNKIQGPPMLEIPRELKENIISVLDSMDNFLGDNNYTSFETSSAFRHEYHDIISVSFLEKLGMALQNNSKRDTTMWNQKLHEEYLEKQNNSNYKEMLEFRMKLPAYEKRNEILKVIRENQVTVISGETGCGKTTQVGQLLLEEACANSKGGEVNILITQPRRLAASSVARRIALERGEPLGESVGYTIRLEGVTPRQYGSIELATNGVLLQRLQNDPALLKVSHLILDEVHERDSICDILMGVVKIIITKRTNLKVILMSATIDAERFCQYFGGCPLLHIPGFMFPVKEFYLEDALELTGFRNFSSPNHNPYGGNYRRRHHVAHFEEERKRSEFLRWIKPYIEDLKRSDKYSNQVLDALYDPQSEVLSHELIAALVQCLARGPEGAILVFMPGHSDISKVCQLIKETCILPPHILLPLHSRLNSLDQQAIFKKPRKGERKIIISTNIAETSITIDDVVYVIDCGRMKITDYVAKDDLSTLNAEWVSEANAHQRRGRAGRVQAGECWRLYTRARASKFAARPAPELLRAPLHEPLLAALLLRLGPAPKFIQTLLDPPQPNAVCNAMNLLHRMRILDDDERLTPLGVHVARLPVAPGAARMLLLASLMSATTPITAIAAAMAFRDPFIFPIGKERDVEKQKVQLSMGLGSDQIAAAEAQIRWENMPNYEARHFCRENFLSWRTLEMLQDMRMQFGHLLHSAKFIESSHPDSQSANLHSRNYSLIKALVVAGLYPNVATYRGKRTLKTDEDNRVELHPGSVNISAPPPASRLVFRLKQKSTKIFLHDCSPAHAMPLLFFGDSYTISGCPISNENVVVEVGGGRWTTSFHTAQLLCRLRKALDALLQTKLENPAPIDWKSFEGQLLNVIIELITAEDNPGIPDSDASD